jgi:alkanesulfonate monooxygenase SsuD/methylene tetrahydromethanopterin reductase-like flavin-dependent oxidoreductase (luciferase family)
VTVTPGGGLTGGRPIRSGALIWSQYTDWTDLMAAASRAERSGCDDLWALDHLMPVNGSPNGPIFESVMTLAGWASVTSTARLGLMVAANTFRHPMLLLKSITALDHLSSGRAVLGLGAGWFEPEHVAFGIPFGGSMGTRLDWLEDAARDLRRLLDGDPVHEVDADRPGATNVPPPVQRRMPLLIGGAGERRTLAIVARYADIWNIGAELPVARHKVGRLEEWCHQVGRDPAEIERSLGIGAVVIRDSVVEGRRVARGMARRNGGWSDGPSVVGPTELVDRLAPYLELGFTTFHLDLPAPFDTQTLERFAGEVSPALRAVAHAGIGSS